MTAAVGAAVAVARSPDAGESENMKRGTSDGNVHESAVRLLLFFSHKSVEFLAISPLFPSSERVSLSVGACSVFKKFRFRRIRNLVKL